MSTNDNFSAVQSGQPFCKVSGLPVNRRNSSVRKGNREMLFEVKAFLNRNIHIRLNQKFALALNVEFGRLKGWLHTKEEAGNEIGDITAGEYFKSNVNCLGLTSCLLLENNQGSSF